jgi:2-methylcitrate dehydratase PrpD
VWILRWRRWCWKTDPQTGLEGKFSVFHAAAVAIVDGAAGEIQFSDARVRDGELAGLRRKVSAVADESLLWTQARVSVRLRDGRVLERDVPHPLGSLERPMSDADLEAKFRGLSRDILGGQQCENLLALCWKLTELPDAGVIVRTAAARVVPVSVPPVSGRIAGRDVS